MNYNATRKKFFSEKYYLRRSAAEITRRASKVNFFSVRRFESILNDEYPVNLDFEILEVLPREEIFTLPTHDRFVTRPFYFRPRSFLNINRAKWDMKTGMAFTSDGKIGIAETSSRTLDFLKSTAVSRANSKNHIHGRYLMLPGNGYYHWLLEDLPNYLHAKSLFPKLETLVWSGAPNFVFDFLRGMEVPYHTTSRYVYIDQVVILSHAESSGYTSQQDLDILRESFRFIPASSLNCEKIFVSRVGGKRSPSWESKLHTKLIKSNWKVVTFQSFNLFDQIAIAKKCRVLAGIHGAGLSNAFAMQPQGKIIELSANNFRNCFLALSGAAGLEFDRIAYEQINEHKEDRLLDEIVSIINELNSFD